MLAERDVPSSALSDMLCKQEAEIQRLSETTVEHA